MKQLLLFVTVILSFSGAAQQDGDRDNSFVIGTGFDPGIYALALQPDGKILAAGMFSTYNSVTANKIVRLNTDGSIDTSFNCSIVGELDFIEAIVLQPNGKIIIGGNYHIGTTQTFLSRLNSDGSIDDTFNQGGSGLHGNGLDSSFGVYSMAAQSDGKILIGGTFSQYNGITLSKPDFIRLQPDGAFDETLNLSGVIGAAYTIEVLPDDKFYVGNRNFILRNQQEGNRAIARLNSDGSFDNSFISNFSFDLSVDSLVSSIAIQPDGKIVIGGYFLSYGEDAAVGIARLNPDGSIDNTFNSGSGISETMALGLSAVNEILLQPDGKFLVCGNFKKYNGVTVNAIVRLNGDGSMDTSFNSGIGFAGTTGIPTRIALQSDNKILLGGFFTKYKNVTTNRILRLSNPSFLGAETFNNDELRLYPNPTKNWLNIQLNNEIAVPSAEIYNMLGQLVLQTSNSADIDVSSLRAGTYLVKINTEKGISTTKFIKE